MSSWDDFKKVAEETVGKAPGAGQYVHVHRDSAFELIAERDALLAERDRLREALEHCIDSLGSEYAIPPECIKQARAALQGAQP